MRLPEAAAPPQLPTAGMRQPRAANAAAVAGAAPARWAAGLLPAVDGAALVAAVVMASVPWPFAVAYAATGLAALASAGLHRVRICLRLGDELPRLLACAFGPLLPLALLRLPLLPLAPLAAGLLVAGRAGHYHLLRSARRHGLVHEPALVVGADPLGVRIARTLAAHPELGLAPYGFLDSRAPAIDGAPPVLGDLAALPEVLATHRIRRVIVCRPDAPEERLVRALRGAPVDVCVVPRLHELGVRVPVGFLDEIWGIPLVPLRRSGLAARVTKRVIDLVLGTLLLVVLTPVMLALALAVWLCSAQPAFFRQRRITESGRAVTVLKLRTVSDDHDGDTLWAAEPGRHLRLGPFLRTTHLDELPQLVNVVRGGMSLVGPRPERPVFAELFTDQIPGYPDRQRMPAGMTGWAQVHGLHGDTSIEERVRFDNQYIEYWSPWRDVVILARTVVKLFPAAAGGRR